MQVVSRETVRGSPWRGPAALVGALAWLGVAVVGAVLAVVFAATMLVIAVMASMLLALTAAAVKVRGAARGTGARGLIEARHVGGHSWVAYRWDGQA
jgi:hypothetical protein